MIRTVWTFAVITVATLIIGPLTIAGGLLGVRKLGFYDWCGRTWSGMILWGSGCPVRAEGTGNIDPDTPQILVGNHQSWFDVPAVATNIPKSYHFVAKKELERVFIFGRAWKAAGHISIDRTDRESAIRSLDQAGEQLRREGSAVVIFAEGTRAPTDELQKFKKGAFMLALHTGVPIVPFGVAGSRRVLPKGRWRLRKGPIIVRFGEPIPTADLTEAERDTLIERVRREVRRLRDEGRAQLPPGRLEQAHEPIH
ncbi:MAG: lysophospholipid acyltransferase family protein [Longimicrobiales bacterium]|nr:lysophospholipid acyltransferase family protein [Longimicrobiales bacterium]